MNRIRKLIYGVPAFLMALALLAGTVTAAYAADTSFPDLTQSGSVSLVLADSDGNPVSGGTITIYEVAALYLDDGQTGYDYTDDFEGCNITLDVEDTSLAETLAEYVADQDITGKDASVGTDGTVSFDGLELGFYLVMQTAESAHYETINPFVVMVPMESDGVWTYEVDASPKVGAVTTIRTEDTDPSEETTETTETTETSNETTAGSTGRTTTTGGSGSSSLPQTGQLNWPIPVLASCGLVLFVTGCILNNSEKKKKNYAL